ncbi:GGDEF domain-containing protein [Marinomonas sp. M1K-6]|uniref:diguanylate cyclase n=1 Tax=Marinomonas profundi TaxID=2726122 RepID=A0A847R5S5_9GAMM|nr:sensor domain-containing diguanylate cyclase [Marinomonas profundi]NLQ17416.1 GGDEF domain-containing protein [Marinomonas profundi]UDV01941.1 diguanylate cyclase [Marinomonas profundi]
MPHNAENITELHWLFDMLHHIDVGLVVLNTHYEVELWNGFMENHSGMSSSIAKKQSLFDLFPDLNRRWLGQKLDNVVALRTPIFISWEQRAYLFPFKSYRPITGLADNMFQNIALRPLANADGTVKHVCLVVYDVTDVATNKVALSSANRLLDQLSKTDALTELNNRSCLDKALVAVFNAFTADALVADKPVTDKLVDDDLVMNSNNTHSLVMADIDNFKKINDQYGHPVGDVVLQKVARILSSGSRKMDFVSRYGGEEFAILLPNTGTDGALFFCEKVRKKVAAAKIVTDKGDISITMSFGVADLRKTDKAVSSWLKRADEALYRAKKEGRNQSVVAD